MTWDEVWGAIGNWALNTGLKIVIAIVLMIVSFKLINYLVRVIQKKAEKSPKYDKTLCDTLSYAGKIILKVLVVLCLIGYLGIDTGGITALIASLGVGVGLAVNGTLSNLAGGVLLVVTRPFRIDDYIEACGYSGTVESIHICTTRLCTPDNKVVLLPNGVLSTSTIVNYSQKDCRRVDIAFSVAYGADFEKAKKIIADLGAAHEKVLSDPAPFVRVTAHGDSSVEITARFWCKNEDYWSVKFDMLEQVKTAFDRENIEIPFPQLDVHVKDSTAETK